MKCLLRIAAILFLIAFFEANSLAQSDSSVSGESAFVPEAAFVSPLKYTNAFFGFSLQLPQSTAFRQYSPVSSDPSRHFLFGLKAVLVRSLSFSHPPTGGPPPPTVRPPASRAADGPLLTGSSYPNNPTDSLQPTETILAITAEETHGVSSQAAQRVVSTEKGTKLIDVEIGGKQFSKSESEEKGSAGKMRFVDFATLLDGYIVEFKITSFDDKLAAQLQQSIESLTFFDPTKAMEIAGPESKPYVANRIRNLGSGTMVGNTYANHDLGFSYQFPAGWVASAATTLDDVVGVGRKEPPGRGPSRPVVDLEATQQCTRVLLWVKQNPEGVKTDEINPEIVVVATDPACLPAFHFPTSASDRDGAKQAGQQIATSFAGAPFIGQGQHSFNSFAVGEHVIIDLWNSPTTPEPAHNFVFTSLECTMAGDYLLTWIFESDNPIELDRLKRIPIQWTSLSIGNPAR